MSECPDDERDWFPQRSICWPTAQLRAAERKFLALHEDKPYHDGTWTLFTENATEATPFHVADGLSIYLARTDENPDDDFLTNRFAKPSGTHGVGSLSADQEETVATPGDSN